jgi:PAS domain S-box-containing protein
LFAFLTAGLVVSFLAGHLHSSTQLARERHQTLGAILSSIADAVIIADAFGNVSFLNHVAEQLTGWSSADARGRKLSDVFRTMNELTRQPLENTAEKVLTSGAVIDLANHTLLLAKDGREIPIDDSVAPIRQDDGSVHGVILVFRDVTDRRHREEDVQRLNRLLKARSASSRALLHATDEAQYLQDVCRLVVEDCGYAMVWVGYAVNDAAKSVLPVASAGKEDGYLQTVQVTWADSARGRGPAGTPIRTGQVVLCPNMLHDPRFLPWRNEALKRGYASAIGLPILRNGKAFAVITVYSSLVNPFSPDEVQLLSELADDLSHGIDTIRLRAAHARAADELARSNKDLEQFAYAASHDLQEPLRMVTGYLKLLDDRYRDKLDQDARVFIHFAVDGASRMSQLITAILQFSRVTTRAAPPEPVALETIVRQAMENLAMAIHESNAEIVFDSLPRVSGDPTQLLQLFQNLLGNALKFRAPDRPPRLCIHAEKDANYWRISVADQGIGIDPQYFDKIFQIFKRLHSQSRYPGTGIGLALCKKIVERHGGRIWLQSQPGQGSTFFFTLPPA